MLLPLKGSDVTFEPEKRCGRQLVHVFPNNSCATGLHNPPCCDNWNHLCYRCPLIMTLNTTSPPLTAAQFSSFYWGANKQHPGVRRPPLGMGSSKEAPRIDARMTIIEGERKDLMEWIELLIDWGGWGGWQDKTPDQWLRQWDKHLLGHCAGNGGLDLTLLFPHCEQGWAVWERTRGAKHLQWPVGVELWFPSLAHVITANLHKGGSMERHLPTISPWFHTRWKSSAYFMSDSLKSFDTELICGWSADCFYLRVLYEEWVTPEIHPQLEMSGLAPKYNPQE